MLLAHFMPVSISDDPRSAASDGPVRARLSLFLWSIDFESVPDVSSCSLVDFLASRALSFLDISP